MVRLTAVSCGVLKTFGYRSKGKYFNHRVPLKYQRFQKDIDPEEIISHYSRDDFYQIEKNKGFRTYKDAQNTMGRKNYILSGLSKNDLASNELFQNELGRQRSIVSRIEKIKIIVGSQPGKDTELMMNRDISTPFDCSRHIHELVTSRSVVAQILPLEEDRGETPKGDETSTNATNPTTKVLWDMHRPLISSCRLNFVHFLDKNPYLVNKIYWRSCSFVLGMAARLAFKDDVKVILHSWPKPDVKSGSFVYDLALGLDAKWEPSEQELRAFTKILWRIKNAELPFERLDVNVDIAKEMFASNPFKLSQIESMSRTDETGTENKISVYRCGGLVDMSIGPMISNTNQIGRITLTGVHAFESPLSEYEGVFYRFQGVSVPQQLPLSAFVYQNLLIKKARELNKIALR